MHQKPSSEKTIFLFFPLLEGGEYERSEVADIQKMVLKHSEGKMKDLFCRKLLTISKSEGLKDFFDKTWFLRHFRGNVLSVSSENTTLNDNHYCSFNPPKVTKNHFVKCVIELTPEA